MIDAIAGWTTSISVARSTGSYVDGRWVEEEDYGSPFDVEAFVHPASLRDIQLLPEGLREVASIAIVSEVELLTLREEGNPTVRGDLVTYDGRTWRVRTSGRHGNPAMPDIGPITHWRAVAVLEQ